VFCLQTRDRRAAGGELLTGAAAVQLPEEPGVRAGAGGRAGAPGGGRAAVACRTLALHRHGVRVRRAPLCSTRRGRLRIARAPLFYLFD
jgi:hypothetical protein